MQFSKELVVKDNALNQYTFYKSAIQLKIFTLIIISIRKAPKENIYSLSIKDIFENFWGSKENYTQLKKVCKNMMKVVDIPKEKWFLLETLFYRINTSNNGVVDFEVNPNLKPYLLNISKNFSYYHKENIVKLVSNYSIRIYELLKQYQNKTGDGWWKVTIDKLRELLSINDKSYPRYPNFKQKIILVAQKELALKTDIKFSFEEQKKGRKVDSIIFYILPNDKAILRENEATKKVPKTVPKYTKNESYQILTKKLKIDESFIAEIYENYDEKRILKNANYTLKALEKDNIKTSIGGFLREALKNDYANQTTLNSIKQEKKKRELEEEKKKAREQEKMRLLKQEFNHSITQKVEEYILNNKDDLEGYFEKFKEKFSFAIWDEKDIKKAIETKPLIRNFFINFLSKKILDKKELDFDYFLKNR